jgi:hypothetical protein
VAAGLEALGRVSVVVPVGPGEAVPSALCDQLAALPRAAEVLVVCAAPGGAARAGVTSAGGPEIAWHVAPAGRATQQNAGAAAASRPWLWFLHADSRLAPATLPALAALIADDRPALGYFDLRFHDGPHLMALNAAGAWVRSRWLGLPFGDQGLALPRPAFAALGGFDPSVARGEDHDLVWRVRRAGLPLRPLRAPLYTSARRYVEHGWWRTTTSHLRETWSQARVFARSGARR